MPVRGVPSSSQNSAAMPKEYSQNFQDFETCVSSGFCVSSRSPRCTSVLCLPLAGPYCFVRRLNHGHAQHISVMLSSLPATHANLPRNSNASSWHPFHLGKRAYERPYSRTSTWVFCFCSASGGRRRSASHAAPPQRVGSSNFSEKRGFFAMLASQR